MENRKIALITGWALLIFGALRFLDFLTRSGPMIIEEIDLATSAVCFFAAYKLLRLKITYYLFLIMLLLVLALIIFR